MSPSPRTQNQRAGAASRQVAWGSDLIRLEIVLWERVDAVLREQHELPLSFFESLHFIASAPTQAVRVGDLARQLRVTVGGTSKLVDRIERAGLIARELDPTDRRAASLVLTADGKRALQAATATYEREVTGFLDPVLTRTEQDQFHNYVARLLLAANQGEGQ